MDYEPLFNLPTGTDDITAVFRTGRGSTYSHHSDNTTTRNRSGEGHRDTTTGIQRRSNRSVFLEPKDLYSISGDFQNPDMATRIDPVKGQKLALTLTENYGPIKAGTVLRQVPYSMEPKVGLHPVEAWEVASPKGDYGSGIHFGNKITEVNPRPDRLKQAGNVAGKVGIAAGLAGAAGAASAGEYRKAAGMLGEMALPWWAGGSDLATDEEARKMAEKAYGKKSGGSVRMPSDYSNGNWKLI